MPSLNELTAAEIAQSVREGSLKAEAVVSACFDRIRERDAEIGAFECHDEDLALAAARRIDRDGHEGPLAGVPFAAKDIIDTKDFPTAWGSPIYSGFRPPRNASCVEHLLRAGAILIGKSVTTEFAFFHPGKTRNPVDTGRTPGGSSSGSAAAVADFMAPLALGSQTAASVIRPGAFCGVFAYKSSLGAVDLQGVMGLARSLDSLGAYARSAADLGLARLALCGEGAHGDRFRESPPEVGVMRGPHWNLCSKDAQDACSRAASLLEDEGARVVQIDHAPEFASLTEAQETVMAYETAQSRIYEYGSCRHLISDRFAALVEQGLGIGFEEYRSALQLGPDMNVFGAKALSELDVVLTPASTGEAPDIEHGTGDPVFSRAWTLLGAPAVSIPAGKGASGLPLAIQLVARKDDDGALLAAAEWVERALAQG